MRVGVGVGVSVAMSVAVAEAMVKRVSAVAAAAAAAMAMAMARAHRMRATCSFCSEPHGMAHSPPGHVPGAAPSAPGEWHGSPSLRLALSPPSPPTPSPSPRGRRAVACSVRSPRPHLLVAAATHLLEHFLRDLELELRRHALERGAARRGHAEEEPTDRDRRRRRPLAACVDHRGV